MINREVYLVMDITPSAILLYTFLLLVQILSADSTRAQKCKPNGPCKAKCKGADIDYTNVFIQG